MRLSSFIMICSVWCFVLLGSPSASANSSVRRPVDVHVITGVKMLLGPMWGWIPMPPSVAVSVDVGKYLRIYGSGTYHPLAYTGQVTAGAGVVFRPVGKDAPRTGGFQLKLPLVAQIGWMKGEPEGDGEDDGGDIHWLQLGPQTGVDLSWWKAGKAGFTLSVHAGFMFHINIDDPEPDMEDADDSYSVFNPDLAVLAGVAF